MNTSRSVFGLAALAASISAVEARADMGAVWIDSVTPVSVTLDWSHPADGNRLASEIPLYRVSWAPVEADERVLASNAVILVGSGSKPYTVSGLDPDTYYRFRVETHATATDVSGNIVNPKFRQVSTVRQRTSAIEGAPMLRLAGAGEGSLQVEFTNPDPSAFDVIRLAYKARWTLQDLCAIASDPLGPRTHWVRSNETRGWTDVTSSGVLRETLPSYVPRVPLALSKCTSYEVVAYGFNIGDTVGTRLGNVQGRTSGGCRFECAAEAIAADHADILSLYATDLVAAHDGTRVLQLVVPDPVDLESGLALLSMDGEDLENDFTALHYLIDAQPDIFASWQEEERSSGGLGLVQFVDEMFPDVGASVRLEVGPPVFQRGDASPNRVLDIADPVKILIYLFDSRGADLVCLDAADANDSSVVDLSDAVYILSFLFGNGPPPAPPHEVCGPDSTADGLDCEFYSSCPE